MPNPNQTCEDDAANGHTLLEMMAVVAMVAIMTSIGAPLLQQQLARRDVENVARRFIQHAQFARQAALFGDGLIVQIVPVEHQWSRGWRVVQTETQSQNAVSMQQVLLSQGDIFRLRLTNGSRALEGLMANVSRLALMRLDLQKASLVGLWRTESCFGTGTLPGLSAMPF